MSHPAIISDYHGESYGGTVTIDDHSHAVVKDAYQIRPAIKPKKTSRNVGHSGREPVSPVTLMRCPKCSGFGERVNGSIQYEECDCHCGFIVSRADANRRTDFPPGSAEKCAIMSARYAHGIKLNLPGDRQEQYAATANAVCAVADDGEDADGYDD